MTKANLHQWWKLSAWMWCTIVMVGPLISYFSKVLYKWSSAKFAVVPYWSDFKMVLKMFWITSVDLNEWLENNLHRQGSYHVLRLIIGLCKLHTLWFENLPADIFMKTTKSEFGQHGNELKLTDVVDLNRGFPIRFNTVLCEIWQHLTTHDVVPW